MYASSQPVHDGAHGNCSPQGQTTQFRSLKIESADQFKYTDPFSGDVAEKQGARFVFSDGSRFVFRLSGVSLGFSPDSGLSSNPGNQ